jgi:hypothetical protein
MIRSEEGGCGLACLAMLLSDYAHKRAYRYLTLEGHPPYSLETLKKAAQKEGMDLVFYRVNHPRDLLAHRQWPILALYEKGGASHLVIVDAVAHGWVRGRDPVQGFFRLKDQDFFALWGGVYGHVSSYRKQVCPYQKPKIVSPVQPLALALFEFLAESALWLGFYFVGQEGSFLWTILLFALFALLEIVRRRLAVYFMKKFDRRWLLSIYDPDKRRFEENYRHYQAERRYLFASPIELVSELLLETALILLLSLNCPAFLYAVGGVLISALGLSFLFARTLRRSGKALAEQEKALFAQETSLESQFASLKGLSEESYRLGSIAEYGHYILILVDLALATIPVLLSGEITLNFYLFHFFALLVLSESFLKLGNWGFGNGEKEPEDRYFYEYFAKKRHPR